jgi:hypothetical protein
MGADNWLEGISKMGAERAKLEAIAVEQNHRHLEAHPKLAFVPSEAGSGEGTGWFDFGGDHVFAYYRHPGRWARHPTFVMSKDLIKQLAKAIK